MVIILSSMYDVVNRYTIKKRKKITGYFTSYFIVDFYYCPCYTKG